MSIKIENVGAALPKCKGLIVIQSETEVPSVSVEIQGVQEKIRDDWEESAVNCLQVVSGFVQGEKGTEPLRFAAKMARDYAVECSIAFKVVCEVEMKKGLTTAYEKGDKSREFMTVTLVRVVEVWGSAKKCLWRADEGGNGAAQSSASVMDSNGRIAKPVEAGRS